jgi:mRNA-degrading endonuclease toxin of MazEF toxin-antitoxin module
VGGLEMKNHKKPDINNSNDLKNAVKQIQSDIYEITINKMNYTLSRKLVFWLDTWFNRYLPDEKTFEYDGLMRYERGMMVKADLGFKVGSEEGGLHYALVVENDNSIQNKTVMVVPLSSLELSKNPEEIDIKYEVFLGFAICKEEIEKISKKIDDNKDKIHTLKNNVRNYEFIEKENLKLINQLNNYQKGSIALVNQMCALSKMRIHFPKNRKDELGSFRLDSHKLNEVDKKIKQLYIKKTLIQSGLEKFKSILKK